MKIESSEFFSNIPVMSDYLVQTFHHVDDYRCLRPLEEFAEDLGSIAHGPSEEESVALLAVLRHRLAAAFKAKGWEGDGDIEVVFVPPFLSSTGETSCTAIFHVKQSNNGTSFIAVPKGVKFALSADE
jgi:hypothetical protein